MEYKLLATIGKPAEVQISAARYIQQDDHIIWSHYAIQGYRMYSTAELLTAAQRR